jgi:hypothetical protein
MRELLMFKTKEQPQADQHDNGANQYICMPRYHCGCSVFGLLMQRAKKKVTLETNCGVKIDRIALLTWAFFFLRTR